MMAAAGKEGGERFGLTGDFRLLNNTTGRVEDADAARRQRHVNPSVVVHGSSSLRCYGASWLGSAVTAAAARESRPDYRISGCTPSTPSKSCAAGCRISWPTTTPPGSSPGTATAPRTRSAPSNAALLSAYPPTYPWPPEQRSRLSQHPDALQSRGPCEAASRWP